MSAIRVIRCDSPLKLEGTLTRKTSNPNVLSQQKTNTVVRRPSARTDLNMAAQVEEVKRCKAAAKQQWLSEVAPQASPEFQTTSLKYAVAESILYHHRNNSSVLVSMLDGEASKKGTNATVGATKRKSTVCGLPKHYVNVLMDDIELISRLDGAAAALNSIRALPLWKLGEQ